MQGVCVKQIFPYFEICFQTSERHAKRLHDWFPISFYIQCKSSEHQFSQKLKKLSLTHLVCISVRSANFRQSGLAITGVPDIFYRV